MEALKLKEPTVISLIFLSIILTFCDNIYSQSRIKGKYCREYELKNFSNCLNFISDNEFEFENSGDMGVIKYGRGEYKIEDGKLILNYNKTKPVKTGHHVSEIWGNNKDSINLKFHFFDFSNNPIPFVNVFYKDSLSMHGYSGIVANKEGTAELILPKGKINTQLSFSNVGFSQYEITISKNYNYNILVYLQKADTGLPIIGQIDTIEIEKKKPKYFTVKNKDGKINTWRLEEQF